MIKNRKRFYEAFDDCEKYVVGLWVGAGYQLDQFGVSACNDEEALEKVVAYIVNHDLTGLYYTIDEVEDMKADAILDGEEVDDDWDKLNNVLYVDATMEGAKAPVYIRSENLRIETVDEYDDEVDVIDNKIEERTSNKRKNRLSEAWCASAKFDPTIYTKKDLGDTSKLIPESIRALWESKRSKTSLARFRESEMMDLADRFICDYLESRKGHPSKGEIVLRTAEKFNISTQEASKKYDELVADGWEYKKSSIEEKPKKKPYTGPAMMDPIDVYICKKLRYRPEWSKDKIVKLAAEEYHTTIEDASKRFDELIEDGWGYREY